MKRICCVAVSTILLAGAGCGGREFPERLPVLNSDGGGDQVDRPSDLPAADLKGGDLTGGDQATGEVPPAGCHADEHACNGVCAKNDDATACGASCVDCTGLPNVKPGGVQCQGGMCVVSATGCLAGHAHCSTNAADVCETDTTKPDNCGACGQKCTAAVPFCANVAGTQSCVLTCGGTTPDKCDTSCVDLKTDLNNCGTCGKVCSIPNAVAACVNGACVMSKCKDGYGDCNADPGCETQLNSSSNCGSCGKSCAVTNGSAMCTSGACGPVTCNAGFGNCDNNPDCETPLNTTTNCGKCGTACDASKPLCSTVNGQQACVSGCSAAAPTRCGSACVDTNSDLANCGGCNKPCSFPNADATCAGGACSQGQCKPGFGECNAAQPGCETPLGTNANCARCGDTCGANTKCDPNSHACVDICNGGGTGNAGHCCTAADCPSNLPVCGNHTCVGKPNGQSCSSGAECANGNCVDGVCCDKACTGQCEACDITGSVGICSPVTGNPHRSGQSARALCGGDPACSGTCNGITTTKCTYPASSCRAASCLSNRLQINPAVCDGNGACPTTTTTMCQFACVASSGMCGGSCVPGDKRCSSNIVQACGNDGAWATDTVCPGNAPKCDSVRLTCVKRSPGDGCNSATECDSGFCAFGVCCNEACDQSCNTSCGGGTCVHKSGKPQCNKRVGVYPGNSDVYLYCDNGKCVGPAFQCGGTTSCDLTNSTCCMVSPDKTSTDQGATVMYACVGSASTCVCGDGSCDTSTNTNHRWKGCLSSIDCPSGLMCAAHQATLGALGFLFFECVPPDSLGNTWTVEVCDPTRPVSGQCTHGGTCRSDLADDPTLGSCS